MNIYILQTTIRPIDISFPYLFPFILIGSPPIWHSNHHHFHFKFTFMSIIKLNSNNFIMSIGDLNFLFNKIIIIFFCFFSSNFPLTGLFKPILSELWLYFIFGALLIYFIDRFDRFNQFIIIIMIHFLNFFADSEKFPKMPKDYH